MSKWTVVRVVGAVSAAAIFASSAMAETYICGSDSGNNACTTNQTSKITSYSKGRTRHWHAGALRKDATFPSLTTSTSNAASGGAKAWKAEAILLGLSGTYGSCISGTP